ncbi:MAG TPA: hypothetical protein VMU94_13025 [Streptosporangiaceae bacterium]|nr:hypothetical protein [Streptosporangiaceae bacterium]
MRKYVQLAAAAASAAIVMVPMASADAATTHVLTIRKAGGPAVRAGAVLKASLVTGTEAVFSLGTGTVKLICKSARLSATVRSNPATPGNATESLTAVTVANCTVSGFPGLTFKSIKAKNLPYKVMVSDAKGDPVTVSGQTVTQPIKFTVTVTASGSPISCSYKAASVTGHASNTASTIAFSKQKFTKAGGNQACLGPAHFSAKFGPVRDTSVKNSPKVFVN